MKNLHTNSGFQCCFVYELEACMGWIDRCAGKSHIVKYQDDHRIKKINST